MKEELNMVKEDKSPFTIGLVTFVAFVVLGLIPLLVYLIDWVFPIQSSLMIMASTLTLISFALIGYLKGAVNQTSKFKSVFSTLFLGVSAALVAYFIGDVLEKMIY